MNAPLKPVDVPRAVPPLLSIVAGYVDSCTFLALFGLFVAQVTGSFVVVGAEFVTHDEGVLIKVLAIPVFFGAGLLTTIFAELLRRRGRRALPWTLAVECVLLTASRHSVTSRMRRRPSRRRCSGSRRWVCRVPRCGC
jgi:uncharacterized membrane protein YoaK (UPF0700 family)